VFLLYIFLGQQLLDGIMEHVEKTMYVTKFDKIFVTLLQNNNNVM